MSAFVNDRDLLLATLPGNVNPTLGKQLLLTADPSAFQVNAAGVGSPGVVTIKANLLNIPGAVLWSVTGATQLGGTGANVRTLAFSDKTAPVAKITATITYAGQAYLAVLSIGNVPASDAVLTTGDVTNIAKIADLVTKISGLETIYGTTASAATSAANAAQSASDAVTAKALAMQAAGDSIGAASAANTSRLAADAANAAAGTSAAAAVTSASTASGYATTADSAATAATNAKIAAESAGGAAAGSASAAVTARDTAVTKAGEAATSATAASTSAATATTKAANASTSAANAATSETNASGSASSASTSALNAANSANAAGGSAGASAGSASTASTQAGAASTSASAANTARVSAESARDAAVGSASAASTSASTANTRASDAATSASAASTSANTANTRAADAATYRDSAAASASAASGYAQASAYDYTAIYARLNNAGGAGVTVEQKLSAQADSITGLSGQAVFAVNVNGQVTGLKIAGTASTAGATSKVTIVASEFEVVASGAAAKQMFSVGTVNGATSVGVGGVAILDDAITARAIDVVNLSAVSAVIGDLQTATSGARTRIRDNVIKQYDIYNNVIMHIGDFSL